MQTITIINPNVKFYIRMEMSAIRRAETEATLEVMPGVNVGVAIISNPQAHPGHPYAMTFRARDDWFTLYEETWFSVGDGQVQKAGEAMIPSSVTPHPSLLPIFY